VETTSPEEPTARDDFLAAMLERGRALLEGPVLEVVEPDATVAFAFQVIQAARGFEYHLTRVARRHAMTGLQARVAWILATSPWAIPMGNIEVALGLSTSGTTRMIGRMRDRGLVTTTVNTSDARSRTVALTDLGKREWERVRADIAAISDELLDAVGARRSARFRAQLNQVEALDERYRNFESLRDPRSILT
jgi:DNA-binding MarR family transcriptional regulator